MEGLSFLDHTGDIGFEIRVGSLEGLFRTAARGLYDIMVERVPAGGGKDETLDLEEAAPDLLLRSFLAELLYRFLASRTILVAFPELRIEGNTLHATGSSVRFDAIRDGLRTELKAVTYHQLDVRREGSGWLARIIFDV